MIEPLAKSSAGLDVHRKTVMCTILKENIEGKIEKKTREFLTYRSDLKDLAKWLKESDVEIYSF